MKLALSLQLQLVLVTLAVLSATATAQQTACSAKDPGPYLATPPTLTMTVPEASRQDLASNPQRYRAEVRLHGEVGGQGSEGIELEVMPDYTFMNPEDSFRFTHEGGVNYLQMFAPLDRDGPTAAVDDDINTFAFTLKCSPRANSSDFLYYSAKVFVQDVNDNDPRFLNVNATSTTRLRVSELSPPGQAVLTVRGEDLDLGSNLTYHLTPRADLADDLSPYFSLDSVTGELSVSGGLDYETVSQGSLVMTVEDGGSPARTATATVLVVVEDGDDQGPAFVYPGCFRDRGRCAWPKYLTTTSLTQGEPLALTPVPNKLQSLVTIRARDLDLAGNPVVFSIASTIPPGQEGLFTVSTARTGQGDYAATLTPTTTTRVSHGFEIFLRAEEQSHQRRSEVAMIFFEDPNHVCSSGSLSSSSSQSGGDGGDATSSSSSSNNSNAGDDEYTTPVIALIVVVAILATLVLCLGLAFLCLRRRGGSHSME